MKKPFLVLFALTILMVVCSCSGKQIIYTPREGQLLVSQDTSYFGDKLLVDEHSITLWSDVIHENTNDDLKINFIFTQGTPKVKGLKSMELLFYGKNEKGGFDKLNAVTDEFTVDYYNGKSITKQNIDLNNIHGPINWKEVNYTYMGVVNDTLVQDFNNLTFNYKSRIRTESYPSEVKLRIKMKYDAYEKNLETVFIKGRYEAPELNLKY